MLGVQMNRHDCIHEEDVIRFLMADIRYMAPRFRGDRSGNRWMTRSLCIGHRAICRCRWNEGNMSELLHDHESSECYVSMGLSCQAFCLRESSLS